MKISPPGPLAKAKSPAIFVHHPQSPHPYHRIILNSRKNGRLISPQERPGAARIQNNVTRLFLCLFTSTD